MPHISFIEEQRINEYLYERMEVWASNVLETNGIWYGFQDHTFVESYAENLHWAWRQSYFDQMQLQLFTNNKESEKNIESFGYERRRMRFWDGEDITYTLWIVGRSIVVISTRKRPHYLFEIHDTQLAQNLAKTFKQLWV